MIAVAGVSWHLLNPPKLPAPPPTGTLATADIAQLVQAAGVLQAKTRVNGGAQVSGQIQTLHAQRVRAVKRGDLLAKTLALDPRKVTALVLAGTAALQKQKSGPAIKHLASAIQLVPPEQLTLKKLINSPLAVARRGARAYAQKPELRKLTPNLKPPCIGLGSCV